MTRLQSLQRFVPRLGPVLAVCVCAALLVPWLSALARPEPENVPDPRTRSFPHIDWCRNYEGGVPRVLFIANSGSAWEPYALAMRMELDYEVYYATGGRVGLFAPETDYYHEGIELYPERVRRLKELLDREWDVIAMVDVPGYCLPTDVHHRILERVAEGTGVVTFNHNRWQNSFKYAGVKTGTYDTLLDSLPLSALTLPGRETGDSRVIDQRGGTLIDSYRTIVEPYEFKAPPVYTVGKGRIVAFVPGGGNYFGGPAIHPPRQQEPEALLQAEYFYAAAAKTLLYAAGREPSVRLATMELDGKVLYPGAPGTGAVSISDAFEGKARVVVRSSGGRIVHESNKSISRLSAGTVSLPIPPLQAGRYFIDLWLLRDGKTIDWAAAGVTVRDRSSAITDLTLGKPSFAPDDVLDAVVRVDGSEDDLRVNARILDAADRVLAVRDDIRVKRGRAAIELALDRTREIYHVLEVDLVGDAGILDTRRQRFFVPRTWEDDLFVYTDAQARNLVGKRRFDIFREYGITTVEVGDEPTAWLASACGLRVGYRYWTTHCHPYTGGCIASPTYGPGVTRTFESVARFLEPYGLVFFSIGDDSGVAQDFCHLNPTWVRSYIEKMATRYDGDYKSFYKEHGMGRGWGDFPHMSWNAKLADVLKASCRPGDMDLIKECWRENYGTIEGFNRASGTSFEDFESVTTQDLATVQYVDPCLLGFRDAMQDRYEKIDALNAAWDTELSAFEDVTIDLPEKKVAEGAYGAAMDKTWHLEDLFIRNMASAGSGVRRVSPDVGIGMGAATLGNVIPDVLAKIDSVMPYKGDRDLELIRSMPHRFCGQTIGVYGGKAVKASARENQAWETVFTGGNFIWFWSMCTGGLMGDLSMNPNRSGVMLDNIREMQQGIARALISAERRHDGIAIHHARRSGALSGYLKEVGTLPSSQVGFQRIVEDLGMQYRYTWTGEVEQGGLRGDEFKVLILPYTQVLSKKEVTEIRRFVKRGGLLIADLRCGTRGWDGKPLAAGALDDVFGIRQDCGQAQPVKASLQLVDAGESPISPPDVAQQGMLRGDASVEAADARARARLGDAPSVLVNRYGRGKAVFLNHAPTTYNVLLNRGQAAGLRALYLELFALGDVTPRFKVVDAGGGVVSGAELAVFRDGAVEYLTLEKSSFQYETYPMAATVELDREYSVYNTRDGEALGRTDSIPLDLQGLGCYVFTLLPYAVTSLDVEAPETAAPGQDVTVDVSLGARGKPGPHLLRVDTFRPDGERLWPMVKTKTVKAKATVTIPLAENDPPGDWRIVVTDVTTGMTEQRILSVRE